MFAQVTELIREQGVLRLWGSVSPGGYEVEQGLLWMQKDCPWVRQVKESLSGDVCGEAPAYLLLVSGPPAPAWGSRTHSKARALAAPRPSWAPEPSRSPAAGWCTSRAGGSGQGLGAGSHLRRTPPPRAGPTHTQASGHPQDHKASKKELGLFGVGDGEVGSNHQREDGHPGPHQREGWDRTWGVRPATQGLSGQQVVRAHVHMHACVCTPGPTWLSSAVVRARLTLAL